MAAVAAEELIDMSPENWQKIKLIFNEAVDLQATARTALLDNLDLETRSEVENLLKASEEDSVLLNGPAVDFAVLIDAPMPERIGQYSIIREIGRGGMGVVYEARRETEDFVQKAAIKVIHNGLNCETILRRFRSEQKILATLEHPNIARFLDGGKTADAMPFYAMEYVEGVAADEYCRDFNINLTDKIKLFRQVCSAVSYAHSQLVVHRDLKPSNILVTKDGTPKLLDFGIAKVLETDTTEPGTATQLGMMTPQYASPEQIRGEKVTTISDVYSLGMIFYTLVTGERPYNTDGRNYAEILEIITQTEPVRPSAINNGSSKLAPLKGDIDNIVLKALQKDPVRRYASVEQFSEDLRRFTVGLPVSARPDTFNYRFRKFVERNRVAAAAGILVFLTLIGGVAATTWQAVRAERQRALAEKRFADVRTLANNVVFKYHDEIAKLDGATTVREMLVSDATTYLDNLSGDATGDAGLQRELALAYLKLGDVQGKLYSANTGNTGGALNSYINAVDLLEMAIRLRPADLVLKDDLLNANDALVVLMARTGHSGDEKQRIMDRSIQILEEIRATEPDDPKRILQLSNIYIRGGDVIGDISNRPSLLKKLEFHQKALPLIERLIQSKPDDPENLRALARSVQRIGTDYLWLGENAELTDLLAETNSNFAFALPYHEKMYQTVERLVEIVPDHPDNRRYRLAALTSYAETLGRNNRKEEALRIADECLNIAEDVQRRDPGNREAALDIAFVNEVFAKIYKSSNENGPAINHTKQALIICETISAADAANSEAKAKVAEHLTSLSQLYTKLGNMEQANAYQRRLENFRKPLRS